MTTFIIISIVLVILVTLSFYRRRQKVNFEKRLRHLCYDRFHIEEGDKNLVDPLYEFILTHPGNKKEISELAFTYYRRLCYNIDDLNQVIQFILTGKPTYQELLRSELEQFHKRNQEAIPLEQTKHHQKDP